MSQYTVLQPNVSQGTVTSAPQPWEAGKNNVQAKGLLTDAAIADSTLSLSICLETSYDGGTNWQSGPKATWTGGSVDPFAPPTPPTYVAPNVASGFSGSGSPPTHVRVRFDLPKITSIGAMVVFS